MAYALVTGASKGIGKEIARCLARRQYALLLVARSEDLLQAHATEWSRQYGVEVHYLALDLSLPGAARQVHGWVDRHHWPVQVLVNDAGYGLWGYFHALEREAQNRMLQINMQTLFDLTYLMLPILRENAPAYILQVGSMAGMQAMPSLAGYSASKAFVNTFSRALHEELKPYQVYVTLLAPGSVDTHFVEVSGMHHMEKMAKKTSLSAAVVAGQAIDAMFKRKRQITPGLSNRITAWAIKHLPKSWVEKVIASVYRKKDGRKV